MQIDQRRRISQADWAHILLILFPLVVLSWRAYNYFSLPPIESFAFSGFYSWGFRSIAILTIVLGAALALKNRWNKPLKFLGIYALVMLILILSTNTFYKLVPTNSTPSKLELIFFHVGAGLILFYALTGVLINIRWFGHSRQKLKGVQS